MDLTPENHIFNCSSYIDFLNAILSGSKKAGTRKPRGSLQKFAVAIGCHPSFVSQVLTERAHLSLDQAIAACNFFGLTGDARDHFLDLTFVARSGTKSTRTYFLSRIAARTKSREDLSQRWRTEATMNEAGNWIFYSSWLNQMVYSLVHLKQFNTPRALADGLKVTIEVVESSLKTLESLKLIDRSSGRIVAAQNFLHLPKDSPVILTHHQSWRQRALEEFSKGSGRGFHYSGAVTISAAHSRLLREKLMAFLDFTRETVRRSESEEAQVLLIDFFPGV